MFLLKSFVLCFVFVYYDECAAANGTMQEVLFWNQIGYDFNGVYYMKDSIYNRDPTVLHFEEEVEDSDRFFVQYNNVPIGLEVYGSTVFVTVPRRRYGIPSTLNFVDTSSSSPLLKPFPNTKSVNDLVSVYRPRVDVCDRLWVVDTGLLEVPDARKQVQAPSIVIFDLKTHQKILRYWLKPTDLVNNRTSGGLTSITVDVERSSCDDAYAYITDLATSGLIVYSLKANDSWRVSDPSFVYDEAQLNFTVAGYTIPWRDNVFSLAIGNDEDGNRKAFYHPLVSTQEFSINADDLKSKKELLVMTEGTRGPNTQSGSHAFHNDTSTIFFANVAQDAILCWNVDTPMTPEYVAIVAQDHKKLVYISDLKVVNDEVWVLVNQMPVFVFSSLDKNVPNFFIHKAKIEDLIRDTSCNKNVDERFAED